MKSMNLTAGEVRALQRGATLIVKPFREQPTYWADGATEETYCKLCGPELYEPTRVDEYGNEFPGKEIYGVYSEDGEWGCSCPYQPGDVVYVRECWAVLGHDLIHCEHKDCTVDPHAIAYKADGAIHSVTISLWPEPVSFTIDELNGTPGWRSSQHMPQWASRWRLEVLSVRAERKEGKWFWVYEVKQL